MVAQRLPRRVSACRAPQRYSHLFNLLFVPLSKLSFEPLNTNQQSTKSVDQQNKSCLLSSPDPLRGGAYNL